MHVFLAQDEKVELCGSTQPSNLFFTSGNAYVSFKTDNSVNGAGFSFSFATVGKLKLQIPLYFR